MVKLYHFIIVMSIVTIYFFLTLLWYIKRPLGVILMAYVIVLYYLY